MARLIVVCCLLLGAGCANTSSNSKDPTVTSAGSGNCEDGDEPNCPACPQCRRCPVCPKTTKPFGGSANRNSPTTCVVGSVKTAGGTVLPVVRARAQVRRGANVIGETWTDDEGMFVWCATTGKVKSGELSVQVEKPPFDPQAKKFSWQNGRHQELIFRMTAEGLTN